MYLYRDGVILATLKCKPFLQIYGTGWQTLHHKHIHNQVKVPGKRKLLWLPPTNGTYRNVYILYSDLVSIHRALIPILTAPSKLYFQ